MNQEEYAVMLHGLELTQEEVNRRIEARFPINTTDVHERALPDWPEYDAPPELGTAEGLASYIQHRGNYEVRTDNRQDVFVVRNRTTGRSTRVSRAYWHQIHTDANMYTERVRLGETIQNEINPIPGEREPAPARDRYLDADPILQYVEGGNTVMPYTATVEPLTPETFRRARDRILDHQR